MNPGGQAQKQCWQCSTLNDINASSCSACGSYLSGVPTSTPTNAQYPRGTPSQSIYGMIQVPEGTHPVWLVVLLSVLFGGWAGMLVNRQIIKGLVYGLLVGLVVSYVTCCIGFLVWYPLTLIDAILVAQKLNRGQAVKEWEFF